MTALKALLMSKTVVTRKQHNVNGWRRLWARRRGLARPTLPHAGLRVRVHIPASPSSSRPWLSPACAWTRRCACPSSTPHSPGLPHASVTLWSGVPVLLLTLSVHEDGPSIDAQLTMTFPSPSCVWIYSGTMFWLMGSGQSEQKHGAP